MVSAPSSASISFHPGHLAGGAASTQMVGHQSQVRETVAPGGGGRTMAPGVRGPASVLAVLLSNGVIPRKSLALWAPRTEASRCGRFGTSRAKRPLPVTGPRDSVPSALRDLTHPRHRRGSPGRRRGEAPLCQLSSYRLSPVQQILASSFLRETGGGVRMFRERSIWAEVQMRGPPRGETGAMNGPFFGVRRVHARPARCGNSHTCPPPPDASRSHRRDLRRW